ncbi:UNVERIFIED_CONTAM: hypothetical protein Slati_4441800 [Sesamum latifolium]|uniref:Uncharacterized protein n=1 Tax=Sesamum latifolium TaxID=2727402 RepID=A0AAW2SSX5_9LAMI
MRATLMWTVNDLPAYGMDSGWSTAGVIRCPVCMEDTCAFYLQNGRKTCYFDCHKQFFPGSLMALDGPKLYFKKMRKYLLHKL